MAVKARASVTLASVRDVASVTRYYLLQSSTASAPSKPSANPPGGSWTKTEPSYSSGSTNSLYFTDLTVFTDGDFSYSDVCLSSSYEAAKAAYNQAVAAASAAQAAQESADAIPSTVPGVNLSPFFSHDIDDVYNVQSNPGGYWVESGSYGWRKNSKYTFTQLEDGWLHVHIDNSTGTSTIRNDCCCPRFNPAIKPGTKYTFLVEFRNNQTTGAGSGTDFYLVQQNGYVQFWGQNTANAPAAKLEGVGGASTLISALPSDGSYAFSRFTKFSEPEGSDHLGAENIMATFVFRANAGLVVDYDIRISLYLGEYWGPYVPYVVSDTSAIRKAAEDAQASADAAQETIDTYISSTEIVVGTQTGATGSWTGAAGFSQLNDGQQIAYWLPYAGSGNASLDLTLAGGGTTGAIPVYYRGSTRATTHFAAGTVIHLTYRVNANVNGTSYTGWWADASYDSGNYYNRLRFEQAVLAKTAITASRIIVGDANGYFHVAAGVSFDITKPILWASSAIAAGATGTNNYLALQTLNLRNNLAGITMTQYETCYLVGTLSGKTFTVRTGNFFTSTVPTTDDGYYYIALGYLATTYQIYLYPEHPIYKFVNGEFMNLNQVAYEAQANVDALETTVTEAKAEIKQTTDAISLEVSKKVGNTEIISKINQSAETVSINASKINLNGAVTANNYFKIKTDGSMEATNGSFKGTVEGSEIIGSSIKFKNTSGRELIVLNGDGLVINGYINSAFRIVDDDNNNIVRFSQDGIDINGAYYLSTLGFDPGRLKLNTLGGVGDAFSTEPIQWIAADGTTYNAVMSDFMSGLKEVTQSLTPSLITLKILRAIDIERNSIFRNGSIFGYGSQIPVCFAGATTKHGINGLVMHLREAKVIWGTIPLEKPIDYSVANADITLHYDSINFYQNNKTLTKGTITCSCYRTFMGIQVVFNNSVSFAGTVHDAVVVEMTGCYLSFS